jgi:hypothetical protein
MWAHICRCLSRYLAEASRPASRPGGLVVAEEITKDSEYKGTRILLDARMDGKGWVSIVGVV